MGIRLRSLLFVVWLYVTLCFFATLGSPILLMKRIWAIRWAKYWVQSVALGLKWICGVTIEFRGLEYRPTGKALIAGKHLSMIDTMAPFLILDDPCFILKAELLAVPFFGWFAGKTEMVAVKRDDAAKALRQMVGLTKQRLTEAPRQVLIFPEGTRQDIGVEPDYKPGVAAHYNSLDMPCHLMATNSGKFWPAHGVDRHSGTIVFEFLPPIEAGLKRGELMNQIISRLESASNRLIG